MLLTVACVALSATRTPKAELVSHLVSFKRRLAEPHRDAIAQLAASDQQHATLRGTWKLLSLDPLADALKEARTPLDSATVAVGEKTISLEMELQVSGYNVGLRLSGDLDAGAGDGSAARALDATVGDAAFYEPCEEFGVSRQIAIAEERLGGALATAPFSSRLVTLYADDDFCVVQAGSGDWLAVLERVQGARVEAVEASRRSMEEASRGEIGSIAFDDEGVYLGD